MFNGSENYNDEYFRAVRAGRRHRAERHDRTTTAPTTSRTCRPPRSTWRCGWSPTAWATCSARSTRRSSTSSAASCRTRSAQGENQPYGRVYDADRRQAFPPGHPYSWDDDRLDGGPERGVARRREGTGSQTYYGAANAVLVLAGDIDVATAKEKVAAVLRRHPAGAAGRRARALDRRAHVHASAARCRTACRRRASTRCGTCPEWRRRRHHAARARRRGADGRQVVAALQATRVRRRRSRPTSARFRSTREIAGCYASMRRRPRVRTRRRSSARSTRRWRGFFATGRRAELERVRARARGSFIRGIERVGGFGGKSNMLAENAVFAGRPDFYKHSLDVMNAATAEQVRGAARALAHRQCATRSKCGPFPTTLAADKEGADRSQIPRPETLPRRAVPGARAGHAAERSARSSSRERHAVPVVQLSLQIDAGLRGRPVRVAGRREPRDGHARRGHDDAERASDQRPDRGLGAELTTGANLDFAVVSLSALKDEPRRLARASTPT